MNKWVARKLRRFADRIDRTNAPKRMGFSFTFEDRRGVVLRYDGRGCPLWYFNDADYERAHTEADTKHTRVNWSTGTVKHVGGGEA